MYTETQMLSDTVPQNTNTLIASANIKETGLYYIEGMLRWKRSEATAAYSIGLINAQYLQYPVASYTLTSTIHGTGNDLSQFITRLEYLKSGTTLYLIAYQSGNASIKNEFQNINLQRILL